MREDQYLRNKLLIILEYIIHDSSALNHKIRTSVESVEKSSKVASHVMHPLQSMKKPKNSITWLRGENKAIFRSSRPEVLWKKVILKILKNSEEDIFAGASFLKSFKLKFLSILKRLKHRWFPMNYAKFLRTSIL